MSKLTTEQIAVYLNKLPYWKFENNTLIKTFQRKNFNDSIVFINSLAEIAEKLDHHPDLQIKGKQVTITLTTHDSNGVTGRDFLFAQQIESLTHK